MVAGNRFDIEAIREEARAAKKAALVRKVVSNVLTLLLVAGLALGAWFGWTWWQRRQAEKAAEAARARRAAEEAECARAQREEARRAEAEAKREAARKAEEARRAAEQAKREAARQAEAEARAAREAALAQAKADEEWQRANKAHVEKTVGALSFTTFSRVCIEAGAEPYVDLKVDEPRWAEMARCVAARRPIELLDMVRGDNVTNDFSQTHYPDRATLKALLANLDNERFTMVVRLKGGASDARRLTLVATDPREGLVLPEGARALKDAAGRTTGWTAPFLFGAAHPLFVMNPSSVERFNREWRALRTRVRKDAAKLDNADAYVDARLQKELPDFVRSIRIELETPPPTPTASAQTQEAAPRARTIKSGLRGSNTDMKTMRGPTARR